MSWLVTTLDGTTDTWTSCREVIQRFPRRNTSTSIFATLGPASDFRRSEVGRPLTVRRSQLTECSSSGQKSSMAAINFSEAESLAHDPGKTLEIHVSEAHLK